LSQHPSPLMHAKTAFSKIVFKVKFSRPILFPISLIYSTYTSKNPVFLKLPVLFVYPMKAVILSYRGGRHTQKTNQLVLEVEGVKNKEDAEKLLDKKVVWKTPTGKEISGVVSKVHGKKGGVLAKFERGLPGQALGTQAEVQ